MRHEDVSGFHQFWRRAGGAFFGRRRVAHFTEPLPAPLTKRGLLLFILCALACATAGCAQPAAVPATAESSPASTPTPETYEDPYTYLSDVFVAGDSLVHEGFEVVKLSKKVRDDYQPPAGQPPPPLLDATYAVLRRKGRVLLTFDGVHGGEREGWDFFAREYRRPDRDELRSKIEAELRGQRLYKFIYAKRPQ